MGFTKTILIIFSLSFIIGGCRTIKTFEQEGVPPKRSLDEVMNQLQKNNFDFTWYDAKIDVDFEGTDLGGSGTAIVRMKKDSVVWVVVKKLGIEGGRMMMRQDSAFLINRFERYFQREKIEKIKKKMGFNLEMQEMQQVMAGNFILPNTSQIKSYKQEGASCIVEANIDGNNVTYNVNAFNLLPQGILINDGSQRFVEIVYHEYAKKQGKTLPIRFDISFESPETTGELRMHIKEVNIDVPKDLTFSIPSRYDEVYW